MNCRTRLLIRLVAVTLLLSQFAASKPVWACSCIQPAVPSQAFTEANAVFVGKVTSVNNPAQFPLISELAHQWSQFTNTPLSSVYYNKQITFAIHDSWKGVTSATTTVSTGSDGGGCGYFFEAGKQYVVYAYDFDGSGLQTNACTRTAEVSFATPDLNYLHTLPKLALSPVPSASLWPLVVGAAIMLALATAAVVWVVRRKPLVKTNHS